MLDLHDDGSVHELPTEEAIRNNEIYARTSWLASETANHSIIRRATVEGYGSLSR